MNLSALILSGLGLGIVFGAFLNGVYPEQIEPWNQYVLQPLGQAFLRLIQFVVVPIVFCSLILGLTRVQNTGQMGRYLAKLLISYLLTGLVALGLGITVALLLQPGSGVTGLALSSPLEPLPPTSLVSWLVKLIPVNPLEALTSGNLLQVIATAALFGVGIQQTQAKALPFVELLESIYLISEKILSVILYTAPLGVFALMSSAVATQGLALMNQLVFYILGFLLAAAVMTGLYIGILFLLQAKPGKFFTSLAPALSLTFSTASSNAALPVVLQNLQETYGLRAEIASFAIPLGTALKRDGSAIFQSFNALFIAQAYHIPLTPSLVFTIALSSFLVSFSTPGVPGSALITMTTVLSAAGLPLEGVALVAGGERLTDGIKTVLNVLSNAANAVMLSHWEVDAPLEVVITRSQQEDT